MSDETFAIRCFMNGKRIRSSEMSRDQALCFRKAARHLANYLTSAYQLKPKRRPVVMGKDDVGNPVRIYSRQQQAEMRRRNQDIVFHKDGYILSYSAGH